MPLPDVVERCISAYSAGMHNDRFLDLCIFEGLCDIEDDFDRLLELAERPHLPPAITSWLARREDLSILKAVASHRATNATVLGALAKTSEEEVRRAVAENWSTPPGVLQQLAKDDSPVVCDRVMENPVASDDIRRSMEDHPQAVVRDKAKHYRKTMTPALRPEWEQLADVQSGHDADTLRRHTDSPYASVRRAVACNASTPADIARDLILNDPDESVRLAGAQSDHARRSMLRDMAKDDQQPQEARIAAIHNQRIPKSALKLLTKHATPAIAKEAKRALAARP